MAVSMTMAESIVVVIGLMLFVMIVMVVIVVIVMMSFVVMTTPSRFDGGNSAAGIDHLQVLVVSGADQIIQELLDLEPVLDQNRGAAEVSEIGGCGLKIMGPQIGRNQCCDFSTIARDRFREQCDRKECGDDLQTFVLTCVVVVGAGRSTGDQPNQERDCAQTREHRFHTGV